MQFVFDGHLQKFALFISCRYLLVTLLLLAIVTAADGYQHRISAELPSLNETGQKVI